MTNTRSREILTRDTYLNLVRAHEQLSADFSELFRSSGLTSAQYNVLRILLGGPKEGAPCQYIGERLINRVPDVTRLIDRMVAAELVTRQRSGTDRRVGLVWVTAKGTKLCRSLDGPTMELHQEQLRRIPTKTLRALNEGLEAILALA